jgi:hypothetical protein
MRHALERGSGRLTYRRLTGLFPPEQASTMSSDKDQKDIEIIPPGQSRRRDGEWIYISLDDTAKSFRELPLHKRIMLGAAWLAGALLFAFIVFLIVASAVLIWIPLLLAAALITAIVLFFRTRFRRS